MSHLSDGSLSLWLTHVRPHSRDYGACARNTIRSWRERSLSKKLSLIGRLAHYVAATMSSHHALGLWHSGGRHAHLQKKQQSIEYSCKYLPINCHW